MSAGTEHIDIHLIYIDRYLTKRLDSIIAARLVDGVDGAIDHIRRNGSGHTESILTENDATAARFFERLDSAILMRNASTQFADGGEFGMGAEIGIATGKKDWDKRRDLAERDAKREAERALASRNRYRRG